MQATQFRFLDILPLDVDLTHRAFNVQTALIDPGLSLKATRLEIKVAANVKHDSVFLEHSAGSVTSGQRAQEQWVSLSTSPISISVKDGGWRAVVTAWRFLVDP